MLDNAPNTPIVARLENSIRFLKEHWNSLIAGISILGFLLFTIIPPWKNINYAYVFIFLGINAIVWTMIEIKSRISREQSIPDRFPSMLKARATILETIRKALTQNAQKKLSIQIIGGKISVMSGMIEEILDEIEVGDLRPSPASIDIYCINPDFLDSLKLDKLLSESCTHYQIRDRAQEYRKSLKHFEDSITRRNESESLKQLSISVRLLRYNAYPVFYAFIIDNSDLFWGTFSWLDDDLDFRGVPNTCYSLNRESERFQDYYSILLDQLTFLRASTNITINMTREDVLLDPREVAKINRIAFDSIAQEYKERHNNRKFQDQNKLLADQIIKSMASRNEDQPVNLLELGPGTGYLLKILTEKGMHVTGIEFSNTMIELARSTVPEAELIEDDFLAHNFANRHFDLIIAIAFIHLFPVSCTRVILEKIWELLDEEGILYISTTAHEIPSEGYFAKEDCETFCVRFRRQFTEAELTNLLMETGFEIIHKERQQEVARKQKEWMVFVCSKKTF